MGLKVLSMVMVAKNEKGNEKGRLVAAPYVFL